MICVRVVDTTSRNVFVEVDFVPRVGETMTFDDVSTRVVDVDHQFYSDGSRQTHILLDGLLPSTWPRTGAWRATASDGR